MRLIMILIISILTFSANGQIKELKRKTGKVSMSGHGKPYTPGKVDVHSTLKVINLDTNKSNRQLAYFIDGKHSNETIIKTINSQLIDSVSVVKKEIVIEKKKYYGQIHIKMKGDYKPELISLADLKTKYTKQNNTPSIFIIDNDIIKSDYSKFLVDEKYILKIEVQKIDNINENLHVDVIRLITKTEENIKKANEIWIRGVDTVMLH